MLTIEQQLSQNLQKLDQAAQEGRASRVTLHKGKLVVETSPTNAARKKAWQLSHRRNKAAEKQLRDMVVEVIGQPDTSLSLRKQIVEGAKANRYSFFTKSDASTIIANEALLLAPVQKKKPAPSKPLPKRRIKLVDAMKSNGPAKRVPRNPNRHRFPDALKESRPAKVIHKKDQREKPPIPFTPPTVVVTPPTEEEVKLDSSRLVDFESTPLQPTSSEIIPTPMSSGGIPYTPTPVDLPEEAAHAPVFNVSGPIDLVPLDNLEEPVIFPKKPAEMLKDACEELASKRPNINLNDTGHFLWLYYTSEFLEQGSDDAVALKEQLDEDFEAAGLSSHYKKLQTEKMWQAVRMLKIDMPPKAFSEHLNAMSEISTPQRLKLTGHLVRDIHENSFRKVLHPNGDPAKRVDALQLEFLEQVKDTDELMEDLGFEVYDPDESDKPLKVRSKEVNVRAQLKDELLTYSTDHESFAQLVDQLKEIDPSRVRQKVREGERLDPEELQAVVAAKKQKLEIAQILGRKWGDSLLLDGRNWPDDDARPSLYKLYELASLDSPEISATLSNWIVNKHHQAQYHPKVLIDGSSFHGLLAALTQVEAGADVTLLLSPEILFNPSETVRLDPQWIESLRFYLGGQFYQLFTSAPALEYAGKSSGLIHQDGFGEISAGSLHQALWNQVLEITKKDSTPLTMISNAQVTDIEEPDQPDGKYLVHLERQGQSTPHRNKTPVDLLINARRAPNAPSSKYLETETATNKTQKVVSHVQATPTQRLACRCAFSVSQSPTLTKPLGESPFDVIVPDKSFRQSLVRNMTERLGHRAQPLPNVREHIQSGIQLELIEHKVNFENRSQYKPVQEIKNLYVAMKNTPMHLKTIHSEHRDSLQLDMELPPPLIKFLQAADAYLQHLEATPEESAIVQQQILAAWFETVAVQMHLPKRGIRPEHLIDDSLLTFTPEHTYLAPPVETLEAYNSTILTITAIGPAAVNNPLSAEANQSAAREHIFRCQELTEKLSEHHTPAGHLNDLENLLEDTGLMEGHYEKLQSFVTAED
ncbi:hypothetical protein [Endozoicomonas arenosclerae]|uniref:hypothetical protein n=1 Tax=Endozoicomonas arenosclerae TaxID=1633495 RepID=UPI0007834023|nr:hypothetical protein [Endozoicomonas arenosclerae]